MRGQSTILVQPTVELDRDTLLLARRFAQMGHLRRLFTRRYFPRDYAAMYYAHQAYGQYVNAPQVRDGRSPLAGDGPVTRAARGAGMF